MPPPLVASKFIPPDLDTRNPGISPLMVSSLFGILHVGFFEKRAHLRGLQNKPIT